MAGGVSSKDQSLEHSQQSYLLMASAGVRVSKEAGGASTSQRLSWGMGEMEVELSEAPVDEFEPPPWDALMATVLLFIDPLGRVCGSVWGASVLGENCPWVAKPPRASHLASYTLPFTHSILAGVPESSALPAYTGI